MGLQLWQLCRHQNVTRPSTPPEKLLHPLLQPCVKSFRGVLWGVGAMGCSSNGISKQVTPFCNYICKISTWAWLSGLFYLKLPRVMPKMWENTLGKVLVIYPKHTEGPSQFLCTSFHHLQSSGSQ